MSVEGAPQWALDVAQNIGAINEAQKAQNTKLDALGEGFKDVQGALKEGAVKMENTATILEAHVNDPNIHLTSDTIEKEINGEFQKRGVPTGVRFDKAWAKEHWKGLSGLITLTTIILGALGMRVA